MGAGRPIVWTEEKRQNAIRAILCDISEKGLSLRKILDKADREILPSNVTFCEWLAEDKELAKQYAYVCELRADSIFEEILEIADDSTGDLKYTEHGEVINSEFVQRSRLRVDARKWMLGKMNPKKYGEKIQTEHSGAIDIQPLFPDVSTNNSN